MDVLDTTDKNISDLNMPRPQDLDGVIPVSQVAATQVTRETETGKTLPPESAAIKPSGEIASPQSTSQGKPLGVSGERVHRISVTTYGRYHIGPKWYEFKPGEVYTVNDTVKDILKKRKILAAV